MWEIATDWFSNTACCADQVLKLVSVLKSLRVHRSAGAVQETCTTMLTASTASNVTEVPAGAPVAAPGETRHHGGGV